MRNEITLFVTTFTTLFAIINPLEALPIFLMLLAGKDVQTHKSVAWRSCFYAAILMLFFLVFGNLTLRVFGVPLSMVRMVGGIILIKIGFGLFMPTPGNGLTSPDSGSGGNDDVAFVPLAMPLMFGPGALATIIGMSALVKETRSISEFLAISLAIVATMFATFLCLAYAHNLVKKIGEKGIDAATRIVGFFVSAMGMGLVFHGLTDVLLTYGIAPK